MGAEPKIIFVYIHFRDTSKARLLASATAINQVMRANFDDNFKMVLSSQDAIGFFVKTSMHPHAINSALVSPDKNKVRLSGDPIVTGDELMVLEIGADSSFLNLGVAQGWLSSK